MGDNKQKPGRDSLEREMKERERRIKEQPFIISVMGQTGVGKSSLINALFSTRLRVGDYLPTTKVPEPVEYKNQQGYKLLFYDMPGIGESEDADSNYLRLYRDKLEKSDLVLWTMHADSRSITFDLHSLRELMHYCDAEGQGRLINKIVFVLTKADLLSPPGWILAKVDSTNAIFAPREKTKVLLQNKIDYYRENFIEPYAHIFKAQTYHEGDFALSEPRFSFDKFNVTYDGLMSSAALSSLIERFPTQRDVFKRLYDNYQVVACSALFRFNLTGLMAVVVNRLEAESIFRFESFYNRQNFSLMPTEQAKELCNLVVYDRKKDKVTFDLAEMKI